ncbi:MoxR family ATPase [archaeon]|nr:MoxR family ATPase [archaeon]
MVEMNYEDLKLGEKAKEAFLGGESPEYITKNCPVYLNTRPVFNGLNVTDLAIAGVLAGIPVLLGGAPGTGKSQLGFDISRSIFGGAKKSGGDSVIIPVGPETDILDPSQKIYREFNIEEGKVVLSENVNASFHLIDEINRTHTINQNQFYSPLNGYISHQGQAFHMGGNDYDYVSLVVTANLGNGEFLGTFPMDPALENRIGVVIDFDYEHFKPTREDKILIDLLREANPKIVRAPLRDLSDKVIQASKEISDISINPGLEALAVINYLKFGLENCPGKNPGEEPSEKGKIWPLVCQDCSRNTDGKYLCSLVKAPVIRTLQSMTKYASALHYLAKLKHPGQEIDTIDLMFKSFELSAAYQHVLNPGVLRQEYSDQNPNFMRDVAQRLKKDFTDNQDMILTTLDEALEGRKSTDYFEHDGEKSLGYAKLKENVKTRVTKLDPFNDNRPVGLGWVNDLVDANLKVHKLREK